MIANWRELIEQPLSVREGAVILLACLEGRGVTLWLDDNRCLRWDFTNSDVHPDEYSGLPLLRDEITSLLHERELREAVMRSWPSLPTILQ
jgi:hypothetical protein